jgi:hypothetical protein
LSGPTPLSLGYTYTVTDCSPATTEIRIVTAYAPNGDTYYASPVTMVSKGTYGVSTATFVFTRLLLDMLEPGEKLTLVVFGRNV